MICGQAALHCYMGLITVFFKIVCGTKFLVLGFLFFCSASECWVLVKSLHFCFQLLFSGFGFSCSTFVSSILVFAVGILFDIFVFNYYSPVLVFPV